MILFTLKCAAEHEFEAWFRDNAAFDRQRSRGLIACPECGDTGVDKAPMAPRLAKSVGDKPVAPPSPRELRRMLQQLRTHVETHCEHVGDRFAEEARRIHRGEAMARGIYGEATEAQSRELADEGIEVARIPWVPASDA
jgi:hypothetical protein